MKRTGRWMIGTIAGVSAWASVSALGAQAVRLGVVMDGPRKALADAWSDAPKQVERAYCIKDWSYAVYHVSRTPPLQDDTIFRVFAIETADASNAGPMSIDFNCPPGMPELHVHTPTTCTGDNLSTCVTGGLNAYSCQPSRGDLEKLVHRGDEFAVVQCDKRAFRFYYPAEYVVPPALAAQEEPAPQTGHQATSGVNLTSRMETP
jgi:hypothetical protein